MVQTLPVAGYELHNGENDDLATSFSTPSDLTRFTLSGEPDEFTSIIHFSSTTMDRIALFA